HAEQRVLRHHGVAATVPAGYIGASHAVRTIIGDSYARSVEQRRDALPDCRSARHKPLWSAAVGYDLVQHAPGFRAGRGHDGDSERRRDDASARHNDQLLGYRPGLPAEPAGSRRTSHPGDLRDLHGAWNSVREFHPSAHDSDRLAVRRLRGAAVAVRLPPAARRVRVRRIDSARGYSEEERYHDDRLRDRSRAERAQVAGGRDRRSGWGTVPSDHDDVDGCAYGDASDRARYRRRRRVQTPTRHRGCGWPGLLAARHAVRDTGVLHLLRRAPRQDPSDGAQRYVENTWHAWRARAPNGTPGIVI